MLGRLIALLLLISPAYAQTGSPKTPSQLNSEVNTLWPDNTAFLITPHDARQTLLDMIASPSIGSANVLSYGADATGVADTSTACMAALNSLPLARGGTIVFPSGIYNFTANCTIPKFAQGATVNIIMTGATLQTSTANVHIFDRVPTDNTDANNIIGGVISFTDGILIGSQVSSQIGINLGATYSSRIQGTQFQSLGIGLDCQFCLALRVIGSKGTGNLIHDWLIENGSWPGAGTCSAQSNHATFEDDRSFAQPGMTAPLAVHASDGVTIRNSIFEGFNPIHEIDFNDENCTTIKSFDIENIHIENSPTAAAFLYSGNGTGEYTLRRIIAQASVANLLIDATGFGSTEGQFNIYDFPTLGNISAPYFSITATQAAGATHFTFLNFAGQASIDLTSTSYWAGSHVPTGLLQLSIYTSGTAGYMNCSICVIGPGPIDVQSGNIQFLNDDTNNVGFNGSNLRPHSVFVGTGGYWANNAQGVSCAAGTVNLTTFTVTEGIVTHC